MDFYSLTVFVHVASAVTLLSGSVVASPAVRRAVMRARTVQDLRAYLAIGRPLSVLEPASAVIVLASGVYLTNTAGFWALGWVQAAVVLWVVNSVVAAALVKPAAGRVASTVALSMDGPVSADLDALRQSPRWSFGGDVLTANDAAMLYVMTMKTGWTGSLVAVIVANAAAAAAEAVFRSRMTRASPVRVRA